MVVSVFSFVEQYKEANPAEVIGGGVAKDKLALTVIPEFAKVQF